jgi:hypothetical protein
MKGGALGLRLLCCVLVVELLGRGIWSPRSVEETMFDYV